MNDHTVIDVAEPGDMDPALNTLGFDGHEEFFRLVSSVNLSTPERFARFRAWQDGAGDKAGLLRVIEANA